MFSKEQLSRYSRHFVLPQIGVSGQKKLSEASVLVIGAGALGSVSLMYLAAAGVGLIGIADYDTVELSNLQRQIIYKTSDILKHQTRKTILIVQVLKLVRDFQVWIVSPYAVQMQKSSLS